MFDAVHESFWSEEDQAPQFAQARTNGCSTTKAMLGIWRYYAEFHDVDWKVLVSTILSAWILGCR
jgi:hypothetical protein